MDLFQLQLGQDMEGKTFCIAVKLEMALPIGEVRQFQVLYDSGAEINFIWYNLAKEYKLIPLLRWWKPIVGFLDEYWINLYSAYEFTVLVTDMYNCTKKVSLQLF